MQQHVWLVCLGLVVGCAEDAGDDELPAEDSLTPVDEAPDATSASTPAKWAGPYDATRTVNGITVKVYFNIETLGVHVTAGSASTPQPTARIRRAGADPATAIPATEFAPVADGSIFHRAATRFGLMPGAEYDVDVSVGSTLITVRGRMQPDQFAYTPLRTLHVSASASATGTGTATNPYRLQAALDAAVAGDRISLLPGTYRDPVVMRRSGTPNQWIQIIGNGPLGSVVLDGTDKSVALASLAWQPWTGYASCVAVDRSKLWVASLAGHPVLQTGTQFESVLRNGRTFVNFARPDRVESFQNITVGMRCQNQSYWYCEPVAEGYYWDAASSKLYLRSASPPSQSTYDVSTGDTVLRVAGADWIWIENLTFRNTRGTGAGTEGRGAVLFEAGADHGVVRGNRFVHGGNAIKATGTGTGTAYVGPSHLRVERNDISYPGLGALGYTVIKNNPFRGGAIMLDAGRQVIVRDNDIHDASHGIGNGGMAGGYDAGKNLEIDIYRNRLSNLSSGRLLIQGQWINARVFENRARTGHVGFNMLEVRVGPAWIVRNVVHGFEGSSLKPKEPHALEPYMFFFHNDFIQTELRHPTHCKISPATACTSGVSWTPSSTGVCRNYQYLWGAPGALGDEDFVHYQFRNNIFYATNYHPLTAVASRLDTLDRGRVFSDGNAFWRAGSLSLFGELATVDGTRYATLADLRSDFPVEAKGVYANPAFDFTTYRVQAPQLIDKAIYIPGVNGAKCGAAADIGAVESDCP